jgi:ribosomal-protein-alanine N-acetyltransferase
MKTYTYPSGHTSPRLITRFLTPEDIEPWSEFFKSPEATELFPPMWKGEPLAASKNWIERQLTRYAENRYGMQILLHRETGEIIGQSGLLAQEVDGIAELEVGYHILRKHWGQGYAPEAARMFFSLGFQLTQVESIISIIDVRNLKSQRVAEKNGLLREKQTRWNDMDDFIYRMNRESWNKSHSNARTE